MLWWIDIWGPTIHRTNPATGKDDTWTAPEYLGTLSVREKGGLVVSMVSGFYFFDPATGKFTAIVDPEAEIADTPLQRRQDRPPGPLLVGHDVRGVRQAAGEDRLAVAARRRPLRPQGDRRRRLLERPRLESRQPHHVLHRQPHQPGLGVRLRRRRPATPPTGVSSSTSARKATSSTVRPSTPTAATG